MADFIEMDVNDLWTQMQDEGGFADDVTPEKSNGGIRDDADDLEMPAYDHFNEDGDFEGNSPIELIDDEYSNENASDLINSIEQGDAAELSADFYQIGDERIDRETVERSVRAYNDFNQREAMITSHMEELQETQQKLNEMHDIAHLQIDEDIYAYRSALESGNLDPATYKEYSITLKQLLRNKDIIQAKYDENYKRLEADKARAAKIAFRDTVIELKHKQGWKDNDFNDVVNFVSTNSIPLTIDKMSPSLFIALQKAIKYDRSQNTTKEKLETRTQKAIAGKPTRSGRTVETADAQKAKRAAVERKVAAGLAKQDDIYDFLID
ncbi:hypothetical protein [Klebsiella quasivariicola]|uniref:Uncharacterized protein n=1 Tax=Klebsiella quasivariicola TaxID=2026240 RepID=A0A8B4TP35_9ENTR|nr:hypothetical protein [Klebsiella quasivariicola]SXD86828.1 Uncharacterised protein [Klebsiella quasivariicola]